MRPATKPEILAELAIIAGRCNGLISKEAIEIWAEDLAIDHDFASIDYRNGGRNISERINEDRRPFPLRGRPQLDDVVALAKAARQGRLERAAAIDPARRLEARNPRTPEQDAANARVMKWLIDEISAGRKVTEGQITDKRAWFHSLETGGLR
jgi:hypothetical protein